jgi:hypothetical protein
MMRWAARPVTNVSPIYKRHHEENAGGGEEHRRRTLRDTVVETRLDEDGPGEGHQSVDDHEHQSEEQWLAELAQQPEQAEGFVRTCLALEVDRCVIAHGPQARDPGQQLGGRRQVQAPAGSPAPESRAE